MITQSPPNHTNKAAVLCEINFGQPEAEHDAPAIATAFYEAQSWKTIAAGAERPFVVGRKGSGKSAIAARLEFILKQRPDCCFVRIVPSTFRHVEVRDLLSCLVNKNASWQYIYRKVWEGIILGQIVRHISDCSSAHCFGRVPTELGLDIARFKIQCGFYVSSIGDTLSEVIAKCVSDASKKADALSQVELRQRLEPYSWAPFVQALYTAS
jgi:hypothetical protein